MSRRVETRAAVYGVKPGALRRKTETTCVRVRRELEALAFAWSEVDAGYCAEVEALYARIEEIERQLPDAMDLLNEPWVGA